LLGRGSVLSAIWYVVVLARSVLGKIDICEPFVRRI